MDLDGTTAVAFDNSGEELARYRKIHMFDIETPSGHVFKESDLFKPGAELKSYDVGDRKVGMSICYDIRFPELFRLMMDQDANVITAPSAFTSATGPDHWETLLRARAIENQSFVIATNQYGRHSDKLHSYGRSVIIDPWGVVLATAADGESIATAEIDFAQLADMRERLPALQNRRDLSKLNRS